VIGFLIVVFYQCFLPLDGESLFSLSCSNHEQSCHLYRIDIDLVNDQATSHEIATWLQSNITDGFGSMAAFKMNKTAFILFTTNCLSRAWLVNMNNISALPTSLTMPTPCTQPMHGYANDSVLGLGTMPNGMGGSAPVSLNIFNRELFNFGDTFIGKYQVLHPQTGFSALNRTAQEEMFNVILYNLINETRHLLSIGIETGQWAMRRIDNNLLRNFGFSTELNAFVSDCSLGGICLLDSFSPQWVLFLPIPNFTNFLDWTFSIAHQRMYFIRKTNIIVVDLSDRSSFYYRILPLTEMSGSINGIDKTIIFE